MRPVVVPGAARAAGGGGRLIDQSKGRIVFLDGRVSSQRKGLDETRCARSARYNHPCHQGFDTVSQNLINVIQSVLTIRF